MDFRTLGVIVVEDHDFQRQVAVSFLAQLGVTKVLHASGGREALAQISAAHWPVDVAICDLDMPGMDGMEFIRHLAEGKLVGAIILLSGLESQLISSVESMASFQGMTVLGTIEKPVSPQKISNLLAKFEPDSGPRQAAPPAMGAAEIEAGLVAGEFTAYYQPKVDFKTLKLVGFEALARWNHPEKGILPPASFIQMAEKSGLIDRITTRMIDVSLTQLKEWMGQGFDTGMAINLSLSYLGSPGIADQISSVAQRLGIEPKAITLEVTESLVTSDLGNVLENLARLRMRGFDISIDDYGTGFSSMQQLSRIPFTELKIDQSFVTGATSRPNMRVILESSLQLSQKLGLRSVAEGIEKDDEWALLKSLGCDIAQGYFIARPMPGEAVPDWHRSWSGGK
jgi:EAL domain-containing protein (putative c-di-GMP-specific phosphodiesterase class I)/ActR/RegA family two-component response regulator